MRLVPTTLLLAYGLKILAIVVIALVVNFLAQRALRRLGQRAQSAEAVRVIEARRALTVVGLAASVVRWTIFLAAGIMILRAVDIDPSPVLVGASVIGFAVAFGTQALVRDVISGLFIILEGQLAVGDKAEINGVYGLVEEIGLRSTRLVAAGGQVRYFSNGAITSITRYPSGAAPYMISVPVPKERVSQARDAVLGILADLDREQLMLAGAPQVREVLDLPTYGPVVRFGVQVLPASRAAFEAKAAARISALLAEAGFALPAGREVVVQSDVAPVEEPGHVSS